MDQGNPTLLASLNEATWTLGVAASYIGDLDGVSGKASYPMVAVVYALLPIKATPKPSAAAAFLNKATKIAKAQAALGIVIQVQGDMWDLDSKVDATGTVPTLFAATPNCTATAGCPHISEYKQFIDSIAANALSFGKAVLLFNGDSHFYRTDNPLKPGQACAIETLTIDTTAKTAKAKADGTTVACSVATVPAFISGDSDPYKNQPHGYDVPNFRRIVVHGSTLPFEYIRLKVDPSANAANSTTAFGPFSWTRVKP
jgi:hypothetical protein